MENQQSNYQTRPNNQNPNYLQEANSKKVLAGILGT